MIKTVPYQMKINIGDVLPELFDTLCNYSVDDKELKIIFSLN